MTTTDSSPATFRPVPYMGVIFVVHEAEKLGFRNGHPDWCNLGQGQPEVGTIDGAPPRLSTIKLDPHDHAYGPVGGTQEARQAVADHYNRLFRQGKQSQFTKDNVAIASGGRLILSRMFATLGQINVGYQVPDYTAYEDMLDYHSYRVTPVQVETHPESGFVTAPAQLRETIQRNNLNAHLLSNPCNPTGQVVRDADLAEYVQIAREQKCTLLLDEFYSHFIYTEDGKPGKAPVSAAEHIDDVNNDPILMIDGLTKNYRYPGWRLGWAVGPPEIIEVINRAASAIDGGPSTAVQRAALSVLKPDLADQETDSLREVFTKKRNLMIDRLEAMGVRCEHKPGGTFYVWANISALPTPINDADIFFREALQRKVMTVPGRFFDVNPGQTRPNNTAYRRWVRFSFGPPIANVELGLDRLSELVREHS